MIKILIENVVGEPFDHDYNLEFLEEQDQTVLSYSDDSQWSEGYRGEHCVIMEDTGDGLEINFHDGETINLDYGQARELFILLSIENDSNIKVVDDELGLLIEHKIIDEEN